MDPFEDGSRFLNPFIVGWSFIWWNELSEDGNYFEILYGWMMIDLVDEPTHLKIVITCSHFILEGSHSIHQTSFRRWLFIPWGKNSCIQTHFIWCKASYFHPSNGFLSFTPPWMLMYIFAGSFLISPCVWPNSGYWYSLFLTSQISLLSRSCHIHTTCSGRFAKIWQDFFSQSTFLSDL
jgi:hypothetical protein